jgi:BolA protein
MTNLTRPELIRDRLTTSLNPTQLEIIDEGHLHIGHAEEGAGHFAIEIASPMFINQSLVACHKLIYAALGDAMQTHIHALRIKINKS